MSFPGKVQPMSLHTLFLATSLSEFSTCGACVSQ